MAVLDTRLCSMNVPLEPVAFTQKGKWATVPIDYTPEVVKSPEALDWWPSSTEFGNIMNITSSIPEEVVLIWSHEYPAKKTATGMGEECTFKVVIPFPDQLFPDVWEASRIANTFQEKIKEHGADILDLKIYIDTTPTWTTDYYGVALIKPSSAYDAVAFPFPWGVVIPLILVLLIVLSFTWLIIEIKELDLGGKIAISLVAVAAVVGVIGFLMLASPSGKKSTVKEVEK
jgi:hypothetical protein